MLAEETALALATPAALPAVGSLVRTRGRDWVVLTGDHLQVVRLRPLTGSERDANGGLLAARTRAGRLGELRPKIIVTIDVVKSDTHWHGFLHHAPDLVIVDEAHMAARPGGNAGTGQHQRTRM